MSEGLNMLLVGPSALTLLRQCQGHVRCCSLQAGGKACMLPA